MVEKISAGSEVQELGIDNLFPWSLLMEFTDPESGFTSTQTLKGTPYEYKRTAHLGIMDRNCPGTITVIHGVGTLYATDTEGNFAFSPWNSKDVVRFTPELVSKYPVLQEFDPDDY